MKAILILLSSLSSIPLATCAIPHHTRASIPFLPPHKQLKKHHDAKSSALNIPRGGDLGPISSKALAQTYGVLAIGDALAATVVPVEVWGKFGIEVERGSNGEHLLGHGLAASAAPLAVTSLLALSGKTSIDEAIGYGFIARCAYITESLLTGKYKELNVPTVPHVVIYLILLGTAFGLLSGNANSEAMAKIVSILLAGHGALLFVNPRIVDDEETKKMAKADGGYMFISSLFAALLAFGMEPVTAMGYTSIACLPLFLTILDLSTFDVLCGMGRGAWTFVLIAFFAASAYGMLT